MEKKIFKNPLLFVLGAIFIIGLIIFITRLNNKDPKKHEAYPIALKTLESITNYKADNKLYALSKESEDDYKKSRNESCQAVLENLNIDNCPNLSESDDLDIMLDAKENNSKVTIQEMIKPTKNNVTFLVRIETEKIYIEQGAKDNSWDQRTLTKFTMVKALSKIPVEMKKIEEVWKINNIYELNKQFGSDISTWNGEEIESTPAILKSDTKYIDDGGEYIKRRAKANEY